MRFDAGDLFFGVDVIHLLEAFGHRVVIVDQVVFDDEGVDISDGIFVLYFLFQNGPAPEAPGAFLCGEDPTVDPTGDNLGCDVSVCQ